MTLLLAVFLIAEWPVSGLWAVGIYVGVRLLLHGWMLMALGTAGKDALSYLRDQRLAALEGHVRAGLTALQETQIVTVANTAMLLALDNELRQKVSTEEVDPALRKLNDELSEARTKMERAASATAEIIEKLGKDLGIDKG